MNVRFFSIIAACTLGLSVALPMESGAEAAFEDVYVMGKGRRTWGFVCIDPTGYPVAPDDETQACGEECVKQTEGEDWVVYEHYCLTAYAYNDAACRAAIARLSAPPECYDRCCGKESPGPYL